MLLFHLFLFMVFSILELWCLDSMLVVHLPSWHSAFRNYVASIPWSLIIYATYLEFNVVYCTVIMLPRFHRVRTRWPGNNLWARLKREKLEPISRIIWKKSRGVYTRACWTRVFLQDFKGICKHGVGSKHVHTNIYIYIYMGLTKIPVCLIAPPWEQWNTMFSRKKLHGKPVS